MKSALASLAHHPPPFRFLLAQVLWRTGWGRWFSFRVRGFRLRLHPANLAWQLWVDPHGRDADLLLIHSLLQPDGIMIDVGANIGFTAIEAALTVGEHGCVHAVEPHPVTFRHMEENLALNHLERRVHSHAVAITDHKESARTLPLTDDRRDDMNAPLPPAGPSKERCVNVPVTTLDTLFASLPRCDLLKLDIEGMELAALRGAERLLLRTRHVLVEAGETNSLRFGVRSADLLAHLHSAGFTVTEANPARSPLSLDRYRDHVGNWLASRSSEAISKERMP